MGCYWEGHIISLSEMARVCIPPPLFRLSLIAFSLDYPVVPSFQDWLFPHDHIPDFWPQASPLPSLSVRCAVTNWSILTEGAHLVPREESRWYSQNDMARYGIDLRDIDNGANIIRLRPDLHRYFDRRWWAIVPKVARAAETETHSPLNTWPTYCHRQQSNSGRRIMTASSST